MKAIKFFNTERVLRDNFFTYAKYVEETAAADSAVSTECAVFVNRLTEAVNNLDRAMVLSMKSAQSDEITAECVQRLSIYRIIRRLVDTCKRAYDVNQQNAAKEVEQVIVDNRFKEDGNMDLITGALYNLVQDLEEKCQDAVVAIGAKGLVDDLKRSNDTVYELVMERNAVISLREKGAVANARKKVVEALDCLYVSVNGKALESREFDNFIDFVNTYIDRMKTQLRIRIRKEGEEEVDGEVIEEEVPNLPGEEEEEEEGNKEEEEEEENKEEEEEEEERPKYRITFRADGQVVATQEYHEGETIVPPECPEGFEWPDDMPEVMPARNLVIVGVEID